MRNTELIYKKSDILAEEYTLIRHKSGLDIYVLRKPFSSVHAIFGTRYGSLDNCFRIKGEADIASVPEGIAHFLEHKMFEMEDGRDAFELYSETGADANAYTTFDHTAYLFNCTENFKSSLEVLLDMVTKPFFTEQTVQKEQGIIGEEIRMCEDRPGNAVFFGIMRAIYKENPVRIPIAGTVESIAEITPELLYRCYNTFYNLHNMYLCICGDVNIDEIIQVADERLKIADEIETERIMPQESERVNTPREIIDMKLSKPKFQIGVKDIMDPEKSFLHEEAVRNLLCEAMFGLSSELYGELYDSGMIGSYNAGFSTMNGVSCMLIGGDADDPEKVYEKFAAYAESVVKNGVPEEEFIRARRVLYSQMAQMFDSSEEAADGMLSALINGEDIFDCAEELYKVEKCELEELAKKLFAEEHYAMCVVK